MLANMASSLVKYKKINTTLAKAKALRGFIEPLITKAKSDTTHSRRTVFKQLKDKYAVTELFRDVAPKIADRPGGYTRILKTGRRLGDNAEMCFIELVDFNEIRTSEQKATTETKKRTRRGRKKADSDTAKPVEAKAEESSGASLEGAAEKEALAKEEDPIVKDAEIVEEIVEATPEVTQEAQEEEPASTDTEAEEVVVEDPAVEEESTQKPEAKTEQNREAADGIKEEVPEEDSSEESNDEEPNEESTTEDEEKKKGE